MKTTGGDIRNYFKPVIGTKPWRVKLGVGSFLTLEFGPRIRDHGHIHGRWRLWVYLSNWKLFHGDRLLVDSEADRKRITVATRRLEEQVLSTIDFDLRTQEAIFGFDDFRLTISPADYLKNVDDRDDYWIFFMPNNEVVAMGPSGIRMEHRNDCDSPLDRKGKEVGIEAAAVRRQVGLED